MAWQPQEDGLKQLAEYLRDSLGGFDRPKQKEAEIVSGSHPVFLCMDLDGKINF
jgi:hypothetical protein